MCQMSIRIEKEMASQIPKAVICNVSHNLPAETEGLNETSRLLVWRVIRTTPNVLDYFCKEGGCTV